VAASPSLQPPRFIELVLSALAQPTPQHVLLDCSDVSNAHCDAHIALVRDTVRRVFQVTCEVVLASPHTQPEHLYRPANTAASASSSSSAVSSPAAAVGAAGTSSASAHTPPTTRKLNASAQQHTASPIEG
jgi:hypothetical protein